MTQKRRHIVCACSHKKVSKSINLTTLGSGTSTGGKKIGLFYFIPPEYIKEHYKQLHTVL